VEYLELVILYLLSTIVNFTFGGCVIESYESKKGRIPTTIIFIVISILLFCSIVSEGENLLEEKILTGKPIEITRQLEKTINYQFINGELLKKEVIE